MVLAIPAAAVVVGVVMLVLANVTWDGLVVDDYYRRGLEINRSLARDAEASRLGLRASVAFPAPGVVEARLSVMNSAAAAASGDRLDLRFARCPGCTDPRPRRCLARRPPSAEFREMVRGT